MIFDTVGKTTYAQVQPLLKAGGRYVPLVFGAGMMLRAMTAKHKIICGVSSDTPEAIEYLRQRIEAGEYRPVVDRTWPLEQAANAHRYVETGHKVGSVVLTIGVTPAQ